MAKPLTKEECQSHLRPVRDVMDLLNGKWKIPIVVVLISGGPLRFNELKEEITGISANMLSKELGELEMNQLVLREIRDTKPITVEYSITEYGESLKDVISELSKWGYKHRKRIMGN